MMESGALIGIKMMASQLATSHPTDGVDEILTVEIFKTILIGIVGVGVVVELMSRGVFDTILVMSILREPSEHM